MLEHVLRALPRLTCLSLRDTSLHVCADALAAALPALPHLAALDVSGNQLHSEFDALAAALPSVPALRTLLLLGAVSTPRTLRALASALRQMPLLETLAIGDPCHSPAQRCTETDTPTAADLLAVLEPLNSMKSLSALDFNYNVDAKTGAEIGTAVAVLTQLRHLRLHSLDICSPAGMHVGAGLARMRSLTSLDLSNAHSDVDLTERYWDESPTGAALVHVLASVSTLTRLQKLQLPRTDLETATCAAILSAVRGLSKLSHVTLPEAGVCDDRQALRGLCVSLAAIPRAQHICFPVFIDCWRQAAMGLWPLAENAGADGLAEIVRASADTEVEIDLQYWFLDADGNGAHLSVDAATRQAVTDTLPLCKSVSLSDLSGVLVEVFCSCLASLTALKELDFRVDAVSWTASLATDTHGLIRSLGVLNGLESLCIQWAVSGAVGACADFCGQLTLLRQLTSLSLYVRGEDHRFLPRVLVSCRALPSLHRLELRLSEETPVWRSGQLVGEEPSWWGSAGPPTGWDVSGLLSLRTLLVSSHGNLDADEAFWGSVAQLPRLQCLHLSDCVDDGRLRTLAEQAQHSGCLALREVTWLQVELVDERADEWLWQFRAALVCRAAGGGLVLEPTPLE